MRLTSRVTSVSRTHISCGTGSLARMDHFIRTNRLDRGMIFILADTNTHRHCLPVLHHQVPSLKNVTLLEIPAGEQVKTLQTAEALWTELLSRGGDRNTLMINLGGGVVSDLGGFVAAGFKRGIPYINIPTSLIGQADAAIGGKTGVNLGNVKNQVGSFYPAMAVFISPDFLETLPPDQLRSGFAEVVKTALIGDSVLWRRMLNRGAGTILGLPATDPFWRELIEKSVASKNRIVCDDFREQKQRKRLNFGHTVGHALESFCNGTEEPVLHGDAVAAGMVAESFLANIKCGMPAEDLGEITSFLRGMMIPPRFTSADIPALITLMGHDKKNQAGTLRFSLIRRPGAAVINVTCSPEEIADSLRFVLSG